jgi:hypothetical protein
MKERGYCNPFNESLKKRFQNGLECTDKCRPSHEVRGARKDTEEIVIEQNSTRFLNA